jgi:ornithine carbamoyltransferase
MKRDFLTFADLPLEDARCVLDLARKLKAEPRDERTRDLAGYTIAVVLEKPSTRTRVSFEVGIAQLGGHPVILDAQSSQLGRGEPIRDTARVLSRYCDAIVYRTFGDERLREMADHAEVPVINALSDGGHPCQILSDVLTAEEQIGRTIAGERVAWIGDGASNMARSWIEAAALFGFELVVAAPEAHRPPVKERGGATFVSDPREAVRGARIINTDVWTSMGQDAERAARLKDLAGFGVTQALLAAAPKDAIVLHCLPAHRGEEIEDAVIEGSQSRVWDQAENRLHVQKALLLFLLGWA